MLFSCVNPPNFPLSPEGNDTVFVGMVSEFTFPFSNVSFSVCCNCQLRPNRCIAIKYDRSTARSTETPTAHSAVHFQLQYFEDFLNLKALLDRVFLGSGRVGGE